MGIPGEIRMPHARHINQNNLECIDCHDHTAHAAPGQSSTGQHGALHDVPRADQGPRTLRLLPLHAAGQRRVASHGLHRRARQAGARQRARLPALSPQQGAVLRRLPPEAHAGALLGQLALRARAKQAKKDRARCLGCHTEKQLCNQCHTVDHPADWATIHAPVAAKGQRSCLVCHPTQMCIDCHAAEGVSMTMRRAVSARRGRPVGARRGLPPAGRCWRPRSRSRSPSRPARPTAASSATPSRTWGPSTSTAWRRASPSTRTTWHGRMHSRMDCTACHAGFQAREHTAEETRGWYRQAKLTACSDCHSSEFRMYDQSFHGNLVMGEGSTQAPACGDCHGSHGIIDPKSRASSGSRSPRSAAVATVRRKRPTWTPTTASPSSWATSRAPCAPTATGTTRSCRSRTPRAPCSKQNVVATCGQCHENANTSFSSFLVHVDRSTPSSSLWVWRWR